MSQDTKPAPFNLGDHVRYVAAQRRTLPGGHGNESELVLVPGMEGVIVLSTGAFSDEGAAAPNPWRCQVQFQNGFQLDITPDIRADFEMAHGLSIADGVSGLRMSLSSRSQSMADIVKLNYSEAGQGMPVVLLHGFPLSSAIWHEQQQSLSDHYRVITPDLRGHGRSPAPSGVYAMDLLARDVLALLDALHITKAVIMGHSMGGYVALAAWTLAPERFLALGLIASQAGADSEEGRQARYKLADQVAAEGSGVVAAAMIPKLFAAGAPIAPSILAQVRQIILTTDPKGIIGTLQGMAVRQDSGTLLPKLNVPALLLTGDSDQIIPPDKAKMMMAAIPKATLTTIEKAGHMPMLEQPEATTTALASFLSDVVK